MFRSVSVKTFAKVKFRAPTTLMTIEICDMKPGVQTRVLCLTETLRAVHLSVNAKADKHVLTAVDAFLCRRRSTGSWAPPLKNSSRFLLFSS
jgi:hypothetical protein